MNWENKNVLVTGANGFVGSWISKKLLEKNAKVIALVKTLEEHGNLKAINIEEKVKIVKADLSSQTEVNKLFQENKIDFVFHLAAQAIVSIANENPVPTFKSNIQGTWNLMEACRNTEGIEGIVVASSDKAYGQHKELPYKEDAALIPKFPYDVSKACADLVARSYFFTYNLPVTVTRCANIYGPGDLNFSRIVPDVISKILKNEIPEIRSDGTPERDYLFIEDVVSGYITIAENIHKENVKGEIFNLGNAKPISVLELYNEIANACEKPELKPKILGKGTPHGEIDSQYLNSEKILKTLNWKPKISLKQGLKKTVEWYTSFLTKKG